MIHVDIMNLVIHKGPTEVVNGLLFAKIIILG